MSNAINPLQTKRKFLFEQESYQIIGACIAVHKKLGFGFEASVYEEALQKELFINKIPFTKHKQLTLYYEGQPLQKQLIADFVCFDKIILDIRVVHRIMEDDKQQLVNYIKATQFELGLLINFGESSLTWKRLIHTT